MAASLGFVSLLLYVVSAAAALANHQHLLDDREGLATHRSRSRSRSRFRPSERAREREPLSRVISLACFSLSLLLVHHIANISCWRLKHQLRQQQQQQNQQQQQQVEKPTTSGRDGSLFTVHSFLIARSSNIFYASSSLPIQIPELYVARRNSESKKTTIRKIEIGRERDLLLHVSELNRSNGQMR